MKFHCWVLWQWSDLPELIDLLWIIGLIVWVSIVQYVSAGRLSWFCCIQLFQASCIRWPSNDCVCWLSSIKDEEKVTFKFIARWIGERRILVVVVFSIQLRGPRSCRYVWAPSCSWLSNVCRTVSSLHCNWSRACRYDRWPSRSWLRNVPRTVSSLHCSWSWSCYVRRSSRSWLENVSRTVSSLHCS